MSKFILLLALLTLLTGAVAPAGALEFSVVYWGERQGQDFPQPPQPGDSLEIGGAWQLAGMVEVFRKAIPATVVVAPGGDLSGSPAAVHTLGLAPARALGKIAPDAYLPGVFDFAHGAEALKEALSKSKIEAILANGYLEGKGALLPPGLIVTKEGIRIAIAGVVPKRIGEVIRRDRSEGLSFSDPVAALKDFIETRRGEADVIIVLSQLGLEADSLLAVSLPSIDVIIEGRSSYALEEPRLIGKTLLCASSAGGISVGRLLYDYDRERKSLTLKRNEFLAVRRGVIARDSDVKRTVDQHQLRYVRDRGDRVAELLTDWNANPDGASNLAQWTTDVLHGLSDAAKLAVIANRDIGRSVRRGYLNRRDLEEIFPHQSSLIAFQITGRELRKAIEHQLVGGPALTWSGLQVVAEKGKEPRISLGNYAILDKDEFAVVTTGQFWDRFRENTGLDPEARPTFIFPLNSQEYLIEAAEKQKMISTPLDGRWMER